MSRSGLCSLIRPVSARHSQLSRPGGDTSEYPAEGAGDTGPEPSRGVPEHNSTGEKTRFHRLGTSLAFSGCQLRDRLAARETHNSSRSRSMAPSGETLARVARVLAESLG